MWKRVMRTNESAAVVLIRLMVSAVFVSKGLQKFLFPDQLGVGRFLKIGLPMPELLAPFERRYSRDGFCDNATGAIRFAHTLTHSLLG
jgi:uncharacterized membrane protein YphA (DoxX/SURF4 family)